MSGLVQACKSSLEIPKIETAVFLGNKANTYSKNPHVSYNMTQKGNKYRIAYKFADHNEQIQTFNTQLNINSVQKAINDFGLPKQLFRPQYVTAGFQSTDNEIKGLTAWEYSAKNKVRPNINKLVKAYRDFAKPIAAFTAKTLGTNATKREIVDFVLKFCQDIPFGVPPSYNQNLHIGGLLTPPHLLVNGYGDCDSKVVLFTSILSFFDEINTVLLYMPNHLGVAIKLPVIENDEFIKIGDEEFVIAEPTGPIRLPLGKKGKEHGPIKEIVSISIGKELQRKTSVEHSEHFIHTGSITFWTDIKDEGEIEVFLNNTQIGKLDISFDQKPECRNINALVVDKEIGYYQLEAKSKKGSIWSGTITVKSNTCKLVRIGH
ncbi:hypothetical protein [Sediminitomix flava]|nr:hypothetical protein [Sediminitomix flava]